MQNKGYHKIDGNSPTISNVKNTWQTSIDIGIPFEPIRLAKATTHQPSDGKVYGCNECFRYCNRS